MKTNIVKRPALISRHLIVTCIYTFGQNLPPSTKIQLENLAKKNLTDFYALQDNYLGRIFNTHYTT